MINDLSTLARVREREIRSSVLARQDLPRPARKGRSTGARYLRMAAGRLGSALVAAGRRLEYSVMEEHPQHGS